MALSFRADILGITMESPPRVVSFAPAAGASDRLTTGHSTHNGSPRGWWGFGRGYAFGIAKSPPAIIVMGAPPTGDNLSAALVD